MNPEGPKFGHYQTIKQGWMVTFADLLALLLTFFVLIFSMNAVQYEDWKAIVEALSDELNPIRAQVSEEELQGPEATKTFDPYAISLTYLNTILDEKIADDPLLGGVSVHRLSDRLIISLPTEDFFAEDAAHLTPESAMALRKIAYSLGQIKNQISVAGHTDLAPAGPGHISNWELSLTRALAVADTLKAAGYRRHIAAFGMADSRFDDLDPNLELGRRYALAARVDIVVADTSAGDGR